MSFLAPKIPAPPAPPPPPPNPPTLGDPAVTGAGAAAAQRAAAAAGAGFGGTLQTSPQGAAPAPTAKPLLGQ